MNALAKLQDETLLTKTDQLVSRERETTAAILRHLQEVERRRLFSKLKYRSLFDYAVKRLKYSEAQAQRRISAMRLLKELPEFASKVESGSLSLTNLSQAQTYFYHESKYRKLHGKQGLNKQEKKKTVQRIIGKDSRTAKMMLLGMHSEPEKVMERVRAVTPELNEVRFAASSSVMRKLNQLRSMLAHRRRNADIAELIEYALDIALEAEAKRLPKKRREILKSGGDECENCGSKFALEVDHRYPKAKGGSDKRDNLRVLCRSCNQRAAIESYGQRKMDKYIN